MSRAAIGPAAVLALLAGFAIAGASVELLTHDVSYYLYVSREVLAGALPYTDYIDPNLPTIIYLGVPLAWLAGVFEVPVWSLFQGFVVLLEVVSVGLCAWLLRTRSLSDDDEAFYEKVLKGVNA